MAAAILLGKALAQEEPMEWAQDWAQATPGLLVALMPSRLLPSPGGKALEGQAAENQKVGNCAQAHQEDGSLCPLLRVFGQRAFLPDLLPWPEAFGLLFFFF